MYSPLQDSSQRPLKGSALDLYTHLGGKKGSNIINVGASFLNIDPHANLARSALAVANALFCIHPVLGPRRLELMTKITEVPFVLLHFVLVFPHTLLFPTHFYRRRGRPPSA